MMLISQIISLNTMSQNVTSPYTILGIGDVETKDFGRYFGSGSASLARRDINSYNYSNPASLTALPFKTMNFDIVTRGRSSSFSFPDSDTSLGFPSNDFVVKRITMAFKVGKTTGLAFGLRPYSSVNYSYIQDKAVLDGNTTYFKMVEGSGGINQFYFSFAKEINKRISIGATGSWLFGSLERVTQYFSPSISLSINKTEKDFYTGALLQGGIQYYSLPGKKWRHQLGIVSSISTNLHGELTTDYADGQASIKKDLETGRSFNLPISAGFSYSAIKYDKFTFSVEGNYQYWKHKKVNYANSYINPAFRLSGGFEYAFLKKQGGAKYEKGYISLGANIENSYLHIRNNSLWDVSFSFGGGKNISRFISVYSGLEVGNKGRKDYNQVKENYTQFILGVTIKDIWIGPKYSKRYD
jgi:hypothetical protein